MKFQIVSLLVSLTFVARVVAQDPYAAVPTCILHCGGPHKLSCPGGYRCCGPIVVGVGGHCVPGAKGICPL